MNIRSINIEQYRHLENLKFDFTYPHGHKKAGKPLEKICLIGQSATGKTGILELIRDNLQVLKNVEIVNNQSIWVGFTPSMKGELCFEYEGFDIVFSDTGIDYDGRSYKGSNVTGGTITGFDLNEMRLVYINADIVSKSSLTIFNEDPTKIFQDDSPSKAGRTKVDGNNSYLWEFSQDLETDRWIELVVNILGYRRRFTQMASELINKGIIGDIRRLNEHYEVWSEKNKNPLIPFAKYFDPLLNKLALEVDLVSTEYLIPFKSLRTGKVVPIKHLSTGTKGLLLSLFPLFELNTRDAIILIDEPERSLFPDIQIELVDYFKQSAPDAQLIVATHSPFVAAAFEPEERFILYFDDNEVCVRRGISPIGDDPNDILKNDFQIDYYNSYGHDAYRKYLKLKQDVSAETDQVKKRELVVELAQLGDKYNF